MMMTDDCGEIPVVQRSQNRKLVGVVTDRDVVCRAVADGSTTRRVHV
jgi:CBS domain-containing protein